jgi:tetratricopeptide (TPR) repeat protein
MKVIHIAAVLVMTGALPASAQKPVPLYTDLGDHTHPITTESKLAQQYFDQGLRLTYGFNHAEAIRSFRAAQAADPQCAMCFWGEALAFGPNINGAMDSASAAAAFKAIKRARALGKNASAGERGFIAALSNRYSGEVKTVQAMRDTAYARAMQALVRTFPADDDARVLHADAQMNLSPWDYYRNEQPKPNAAAALASLNTVLKRSPNHAGACHFYIHAVEAVNPERAVPCAERLPNLMPGAGHIVHMPAHIYIRVGRYDDAIDRNVHALHADEEHIADAAPDAAYRLAYYPHNAHFLWFAATMAGRQQTAIDAAIKTRNLTNQELMRAPGLGALQHYLVTPLFAYVRFEQWESVLKEPAPAADMPYPLGIYHYARAVAMAAQGAAAEAEKELAELRAQRVRPELKDVSIWGLNPGTAVLDVAIEAAAGEIALAQGDVASAVAHFRKGIAIEDKLGYDEPPTWHLPVRQQLGKALVQQGELAEATRVFEEDLKRHPKNVWSLAGVESARKRVSK